jgi:riboflavin kinase/FMN adenylyltransferase
VFDFVGDLYGQQLEVILEKKLRNEVKFDSFSELKEQIEKDIRGAKEWHENDDSVVIASQ